MAKTKEEIRQVIASLLQGGAEITGTHDNANDTYTFDLSPHGDDYHDKTYTTAQNGGENIYVQNTAPSSPSPKDIWFDTA